MTEWGCPSPCACSCLTDILQAHEMEKKVLYEALERALSHFAVMGTEQAKRAAEEIEAVLRPDATPAGAVVAAMSGATAGETATEDQKNALYAAYKGISVLSIMCRKAGLSMGEQRSKDLMNELAAVFPELPGLLAIDR